MNKGTIIRTVLTIATCFNTALMATDITGFNNPKLDLAYKIASIVANFIIVFCSTYFNNDYTDAASIGTGYTRQLKNEQKAGYIGERFFGMYEDDEEVDEDE